jgi:hypothetical protein
MRLALALLVVLAGCAKSSPPSEGQPGTVGPASASPATSEEPRAAADASLRTLRDAEPSVDVAAHLGDASAPFALAPPDPACNKPELDLAQVIADARCAIRAADAKHLREALEKPGKKVPLRQEARLGEGGRATLRLVNDGTEPLALPLSWHAKTPSFSAFAEAADHAVYDLAPPTLEVKDVDVERGHFARIVLAPGASATASVLVSTTVNKRLAPPCEAGTCAPARLPAGRYVLYLGELVVDVEAGMPARLAWTVP